MQGILEGRTRRKQGRVRLHQARPLHLRRDLRPVRGTHTEFQGKPEHPGKALRRH